MGLEPGYCLHCSRVCGVGFREQNNDVINVGYHFGADAWWICPEIAEKLQQVHAITEESQGYTPAVPLRTSG